MCVAVAATLSACIDSPTIETEPYPAVTMPPEWEGETQTTPNQDSDASLDEWSKWTADSDLDRPPDYVERLSQISDLLALGVEFEPSGPTYRQQGWVGVAQYHTLCIIGLGVDSQSVQDGAVMVTVYSRYDTDVTVTTTFSNDYEAIRTALQPYAVWCELGGSLPDPHEGYLSVPPGVPTVPA